MTRAEVVFEPKLEYIVQVGTERLAPGAYETRTCVEWEFYAAYDDETSARLTAKSEARDREHVRVIRRTDTPPEG